MRHRAQRRRFSLPYPRRLLRARLLLARATARPGRRMAGGLAVMLLLATATVVTAETLREGANPAEYDRPMSEGQLGGRSDATRGLERAPRGTTPTPQAAEGSTHGGTPVGAPSSPPTSEAVGAPATTPEPTSLLPSTPPAQPGAGLAARLPSAPADVPSDGVVPTARTSASTPTFTPGGEAAGGGYAGGADGYGDSTTQPQTTDQDSPETTLVSGPALRYVASFVFHSDEDGTFQCSLDGQTFSACESPRLYTDLAAGWHTFAVRAVDRSGNPDPTPAVQRWHSAE